MLSSMSNAQPLDRPILRTMAYFDVFDYPLTAAEIWRWIYPEHLTSQPIALGEIEPGLLALVADGRISQQDTYYFLPGREGIVATRQERFLLDKKKWQRAKTVARFVEVVPFVKMVAVVNTLAINNAKEESDIDLLIITSPGHIWLSRWLVTGIVAMLGYRRHAQHIKNKICLSFYATNDAMNFDKVRHLPEDQHFTFWTSQVTPLLDFSVYEKFVQANDWVRARLPNAWQWEWEKTVMKPNTWLRSIKTFLETGLSTGLALRLESLARDYQLKRMSKNILSKVSQGTTEVIVAEEMLKFHEEDRRTKYNADFQERLTRLEI